MAAANKVIPSVQMVGMRALEIKHQDFFAGDGNYPDMFNIAFVKQGMLGMLLSASWGAHGGTTEHFGIYFYAEGDQAKNQTRPELTQNMETSRHFLSSDVQQWHFSASKVIYKAWNMFERRKRWLLHYFLLRK